MKKAIALISTFLLLYSIWGQSSVSAGLLPRINVSVKLSDRFSLMNSVESRQILLEKIEENLTYSYALTDLTSILSWKTGANKSLNGGYTMRIIDKNLLHRLIQQFNIVTDLDGLRIGHRFASDQTFGSGLPWEFRARYRISLEKPLSGLFVDPKEFYFKFSNEYLWSYQDQNSELEIRIIPLLGYIFNPKNRIEAGIDYRINEFYLSASESNIWVTIMWYSSLGKN